jgi:hypothetical protein
VCRIFQTGLIPILDGIDGVWDLLDTSVMKFAAGKTLIQNVALVDVDSQARIHHFRPE